MLISVSIATGTALPGLGARQTAANNSGGKGSAEAKIAAMRAAGIVVADSPAHLGEAILKAIRG